MEAIDATYQSTQLPIENEKVINNKDDPFFADALFVRENEGELSFEKLLDAVYDDAFEMPFKDREIDLVQDVSMLTEELVASDDASSLMSAKVKKSAMPKCENAGQLQDSFQFPIEPLVSDIPVTEIEIEVPTYHIEKKDGKQKVKGDSEKVEKKDEFEKKSPLVENGSFPEKNVHNLFKKKAEVLKKTEKKKEEQIKLDANMEGLGSSVVQKQKRMSPKKLPIVVEDYRKVESEGNEEIVGSGDGSYEGDFQSFSGYTSDSKEVFTKFSDESILAEQAEGTKEGQFSSILAEQIKASSAEIVERGKIVLRDGNIGEIRLQLKPAHLGNVQIQLKLNEQKKLQGDVVVSSQEAYEAFDEGMGELLASFRDAGFDASSFNLNWKGAKEDENLKENLVEQYFSPEKTHLTLSEKLKIAENKYRAGQAETLNVLA